MLTKTKIALAAALIAGTTSVAFADGYDPNLGNRYPSYNEPVAAQGTYQTAPVSRARKGQLHSAPVRLQTQGNSWENHGTGWEPASQGAGRLPRAFQYQEQDGYPQSPPSIGGN
jgi:hypothetical protein